MEMVYPAEKEIMNFFSGRSGFLKVHRISELLISPKHGNPQDVEINHIKKLLHLLKSQGYLLVKNEGSDIYNEEFSSTPDRIERYNEQKNVKSTEISESIRAFLNNRRYGQGKRSYERISRHYPNIERAVMEAGLLKAGAIQYRDPNNKELWGIPSRNEIPKPVDGGQNIKISNSNFHFGHGDNVTRDKVTTEELKKSFQWLNWLVGVATIFGFVFSVYVHYNPNQTFGFGQQTLVLGTATSTPNISEIFQKKRTMETSLEQREFINKFENARVFGSGDFSDIDKPMDNNYLVGINVNGVLVSCVFDSDSATEQKLLLFKKGQNINFVGTFTNSTVYGGGWSVHNCVLAE